MQQREKEISNSKKNLEQLFTQLDRSCSGVSLNLSTDVEDVRDSKIASLESSLSALKSEKRELDLRLLSLETVQGTSFNCCFITWTLLIVCFLFCRSKRMSWTRNEWIKSKSWSPFSGKPHAAGSVAEFSCFRGYFV